jgi:RNA polymerase sigma-70 factor (ECF subfamily)
MTTPLSDSLPARVEFEALMQDIRPELHRYATRMTGSVIDGEDVVQEALIKANASFSSLSSNANVRGWLFRITHNQAIDHLRRHRNEPAELLDEHPMTEETEVPLEEKELAAIALSVFLKLAPRQRSCVILKDVLGYSLAEISELLNATVPEIKATLHRGRTRLRAHASGGEINAPSLDEHERELLARYIDRFNARDFDAVRDMLADEIQLDVMGRAKMRGVAEVSNIYFNNYRKHEDWRLGPGLVEGRLAILVYDPREASPVPTYFMLLTWDGKGVSTIRDYRYVRYVMRDASIIHL